MAKIGHFFPGSNTAHGFAGFFRELHLRADRAVILKGGPGVGKSTLMRDIGRRYERRGMAVEYYYCSGDPDSLDAVFAPGPGLLVMDGTAPHVVDPALPGAKDGILNLGQCLEEKQLYAQRGEISALTEEISQCYARAYRYLRAALSLREDASAVYSRALDEKETRMLKRELTAMIPCGAPGGDLHAFLQAITWKGVSQHADALEAERAVCLEAPWGFDADALLRPVWEEAWLRGVERRAFHDPLDAGRLAHLCVGNAVFTTAALLDARTIAPSLDAGVLRRESARLAFDRAAYQLMETQAVEALAQAKEKHDALERYYIDAMDYTRLEEVRREFMKTLP